jgi:hypothetical protein
MARITDDRLVTAIAGDKTAANSLEDQRCVGRSARLRVPLSPSLDVALFRCWLIYSETQHCSGYRLLPATSTGYSCKRNSTPSPPSHAPSPHPHLIRFLRLPRSIYLSSMLTHSSCASCTAVRLLSHPVSLTLSYDFASSLVGNCVYLL